jgi:hypothetical protein
MLEDLTERAAVLLQPAREPARGIQLHGVERARDPAGRAGQGDAERVAERVGRIGRDQEDAAVAPAALRRAKALGFGDGEGGGVRRLSDAAFASIEDEAWLKVRSQKYEVRNERRKGKVSDFDFSVLSSHFSVLTSSKLWMSTPVIFSSGDMEIGPC